MTAAARLRNPGQRRGRRHLYFLFYLSFATASWRGDISCFTISYAPLPRRNDKQSALSARLILNPMCKLLARDSPTRVRRSRRRGDEDVEAVAKVGPQYQTIL